MITKARLEKHLNKLISQSATTVQANQKYLVPCIATNDSGSPTSNHIQILYYPMKLSYHLSIR